MVFEANGAIYLRHTDRKREKCTSKRRGQLWKKMMMCNAGEREKAPNWLFTFFLRWNVMRLLAPKSRSSLRRLANTKRQNKYILVREVSSFCRSKDGWPLMVSLSLCRIVLCGICGTRTSHTYFDRVCTAVAVSFRRRFAAASAYCTSHATTMKKKMHLVWRQPLCASSPCNVWHLLSLIVRAAFYLSFMFSFVFGCFFFVL